ncbi:MAG: hypothetical protein AUG51_10255 [Acidobacteria bacterium 13_1_20CM_3_53_8]|nr:MAG: hypothetical protein AUG51_10255 [Acidobacteria bacterium 13_1_20CM_3_53_8]
MNNREEKNGARKKLYVKPKMRRIELRPQEAVLGACKANSSTVGGGAGGQCNPVSCQAHGS